MSLCNGGIHSSNVRSLFNGCTGRSIVGGLFLVSPFHEGIVCFTGSELLDAAASRAAFVSFFFICFSLGLTVSVHKDFIYYLQELCGIHPSEAFQLLEFSLDVCMGLSHKGSINHLLILYCLRVEQGVYPKRFHRNWLGSPLLFGLPL